MTEANNSGSSRILPVLLILAGITLLGVAFLVLVGPFGRGNSDQGAAGEAVSDVPAAVPMYRTSDFYGINTGAQVIQSNTSYRLESSSVASDFVFETRVKITATGTADASAGMFFLGMDNETHYNFGIYPNQDRVKLYDPVSKKFLLDSYRPGAFSINDWHTLKAAVTRGIIRLYVDGAEVTPPEGIASTRGTGFEGLRVKSSDALFDDCRLASALTGATVFSDDFSQGADGWQPQVTDGWSVEKDGDNDVYHGSILLGEDRIASAELSPDFIKSMDLVAATGATSIRVFFYWNNIQPQGPDSFFWDYADATVMAARERNLTVVPVLVYAPNWAIAPEKRGDQASFAYPPANQADFYRFTQAVVQRYRPEGDLSTERGWIDGYGIDHYEIGHEFNVSRVFKPSGELFFTGWLGDINDFVDLLKTGHDAVKSVCPDCKVLNGAAADGMITSYSGRTDPTGLRQYLWQGVEDLYDTIQQRNPGDPHAVDRYFDILNVHTYEWFVFSAAGQFPDLNRPYGFPDPRWYQDRLGNTMDVMAKYGDSGRDVWLTETTYPSTDDGDPLAGFLGDQGQADAVKMVYAQSAVFPQVKRVYWWYSIDVQHSVGLIRKDLTTKPSWDAYRELTGRKQQELAMAEAPTAP